MSDKIAEGIRTVSGDVMLLCSVIMHRQPKEWCITGDGKMISSALFGYRKLEDCRHEKTVDELRKVFAGKVVTIFGQEYVSEADCADYNRKLGE